MRNVRLAFAILFAAVALSTTACTSPTGPSKPSTDVIQPGI